MAASGGLDLLDDGLRPAADRFAAQYQALRAREGWSVAGGREDPHGGLQRLWKRRLRSVSGAAALLAREWAPTTRPVVADVGSGGGWAARQMRHAAVIAFDLLDVKPGDAELTVRADMRSLPVRDAALDAALYAASLHYAPVEQAVAEAARVLRPGGLMVAVDSPIYANESSTAKAATRSAAYYAEAGYPELAGRYHPIDADGLRSALDASGFDIERLSVVGRWGRFARNAQASLVVARRLP